MIVSDVLEQCSFDFDLCAESSVFRDKNGRRYEFKEDDGLKISYYEFGLIVVHFFKRLLEDASGPTLANNLVSIEDQINARRYLIDGCIKENGYYQYTQYREHGIRNYEDRDVEFIDSDEEHESAITMQHIAIFINSDEQTLKDRIKRWAFGGWVRDDQFYINAMRVL